MRPSLQKVTKNSGRILAITGNGQMVEIRKKISRIPILMVIQKMTNQFYTKNESNLLLLLIIAPFYNAVVKSPNFKEWTQRKSKWLNAKMRCV